MKMFLDFFTRIYNNRKSLLIFIFFSSILVSLIFLAFFGKIGPAQHGIPGGDYFRAYEPVANNILQGKGITLDGKVPLNFGPGYPIILAGIFVISQFTGIDKLDLIILFNIILTAISAVLLFLIAENIFNKKIALTSSFLWMSYPFNLWFVKNPHTEVPFLLLMFLGIFFCILALKKKDLKFAFLSGFFLGLSAFIRLIGLFFPLFLALVIFFLLKDNLKRKFLVSIMLLAGSLIVIIPWAVYSILEIGIFGPLSATRTESIMYGYTVLIAPMEDENDRAILPDDVALLIERMKSEDLSSYPKLFNFFYQELLNNPFTLFKLIGLKLARCWYATSQQWWEKQILLVQFLYLASGLFGLFYAIKNAKDKIRDIIFLLAIVFYFWLMAFANVSIMRYLVPAMALVIIFSAVSVNILIKRLFKRRHSLP